MSLMCSAWLLQLNIYSLSVLSYPPMSVSVDTCRRNICKYVLYVRLRARVEDCTCNTGGLPACHLHRALWSVIYYAFEKHAGTTSINEWTRDEALDRVTILTTPVHITAAVNVLYALITYDHEIYVLVSDLLELHIRI